jgi:OOP family OmpA-OmpF porin
LESNFYRSLAVMVGLAGVLSGCALLRPEPPPPAPVAPAPAPVIPERFPSILFESNTVTLSPAQRQQVRDIAAVLKRPDVANEPVAVQGHSDAVGSSVANERVSLARARAIANELIFNGVPPERLTVIGLGESQPAAPNSHPDGTDNPQGRALNRRVDVVIERRPGNM